MLDQADELLKVGEDVDWRGIMGLRVAWRAFERPARVLFWLGIAGIVTAVGLTIAIYLATEHLPQAAFEWDERHSVAVVSIGVTLAGLALGLAYLLAGAAQTNLPVFVLVAAVSTFVLLLLVPGFGAAELTGFWVVLPVLPPILLAPGALARSEGPAWGRGLRWPAALLVGSGGAFVLVFLSPLRGLVASDLRWVAVLGVGSVIGGLLLLARPLGRRLGLVSEFVLTAVVLGTLALRQVTVAAQQPDDAAASLNVVVQFLAGYLAIFWFILGGQIADEARQLTDRALTKLRHSTRRLNTPIVVFGGWGLAALAAWSIGPLLVLAAWAGAWSQSSEPDWLTAVLLVLDYLPFISAGFAALALALRLAGRLSNDGLWAIFRWSAVVVVLACLLLQTAFGSVEEETGRLTIWALIVFIVGLLGGAIGSTSSVITQGSQWFPQRGRLLVWLGVLLTMAAISHFSLNANLRQLNQVIQLETFFGALCLSIPGLVAGVLNSESGRVAQRPGHLLPWYVAGIAAAWLAYVAAGALTPLFGGGANLALRLLTVETTLGLTIYLAVRNHWGERAGLLLSASSVSLGAATFIAHPLALLPLVPLAWQLGPALDAPGIAGSWQLDATTLLALYGLLWLNGLGLAGLLLGLRRWRAAWFPAGRQAAPAAQAIAAPAAAAAGPAPSPETGSLPTHES